MNNETFAQFIGNSVCVWTKYWSGAQSEHAVLHMWATYSHIATAKARFATNARARG